MTQQLQNPYGVQSTAPGVRQGQLPYGQSSPGYQSSGYPAGQQFGGQQFGPQQPSGQGFYASQQGVGMQGPQQQGSFGQSMGESIPGDIQQAVGDLHELEMIAQWTKVQAENRGDVHVARRCDDLVDLAHVQKRLILRQSPAADMFGQSVRTTIEQTVQELGQQQSTPGVGAVITRAQQALSTTSQALGRIQVWGQPGEQFQR